MKANLINLTYEVELKTGEKLVLPESLIGGIGEGRWVVTIKPVASTEEERYVIRHHSAFLNSYVAEDESLYDDNSAG